MVIPIEMSRLLVDYRCKNEFLLEIRSVKDGPNDRI